MGSDRAFDPASSAGRQAARDGYARGDERGALRFAHGLPMAATAEDFPPRSTVYSYFWEWSRYGVLDRIHHTLLVACREAEGREASPTAAIIDTQAVKATEKGAAAGIPLATTRAKRSRASSATRLSIR
jgi:transposase